MTTIAPTTSIARASSRAGTRGLTTRAGGASSRVQVGNYSREGAHAPSGVRLAGPMRGNGRGGSAVVRAMGPEELEAAQLWSVAGLGLFIGIAAVGSGLKGEPEPCPACGSNPACGGGLLWHGIAAALFLYVILAVLLFAVVAPAYAVWDCRRCRRRPERAKFHRIVACGCCWPCYGVHSWRRRRRVARTEKEAEGT